MTGSFDDVDLRQPQRRADLSVSQLDDELVIYDPKTGESFVINQTGRMVLDLCDGNRTTTEIATIIADVHGISFEQAYADVTELIISLHRSSLLDESDLR